VCRVASKHTVHQLAATRAFVTTAPVCGARELPRSWRIRDVVAADFHPVVLTRSRRAGQQARVAVGPLGQAPARAAVLRWFRENGSPIRRRAGCVDETLPSKPGAGTSRAERDEMSHVATYESRTQPYFSRPARSEARAQVRQIGTAIAIYVGVPCRCPGRHRRRKEGRYGARYRQHEVGCGRARRVACGSSGSDPP
jgi:hypothetical protein